MAKTKSVAKSAASTPPVDTREACVNAAHAVIAEHGIENLSLRDVARRLGVSHQAPYKHFASRDHLLVEVIRRSFQRFASALDARQSSDDPAEDMASLGREYLLFALQNPLEYRLMFGTPWPASGNHEELARDARRAFDILVDALARLHGGKAAQRKLVELDAMFVWSTMHGLASVTQSNVMGGLGLRPGVIEKSVEHVMQRIGDALGQGGKCVP